MQKNVLMFPDSILSFLSHCLLCIWMTPYKFLPIKWMHLLCFSMLNCIPVDYHMRYIENKVVILVIVSADYFIKGNSC